MTDGEEDEDMLSDTSGSGFDRVRVELDHLSLVPVGAAAAFTIRVAGGDDAELAVSVQGRFFFLEKNRFYFSQSEQQGMRKTGKAAGVFAWWWGAF